MHPLTRQTGRQSGHRHDPVHPQQLQQNPSNPSSTKDTDAAQGKGVLLTRRVCVLYMHALHQLCRLVDGEKQECAVTRRRRRTCSARSTTESTRAYLHWKDSRMPNAAASSIAIPTTGASAPQASAGVGAGRPSDGARQPHALLHAAL